MSFTLLTQRLLNVSGQIVTLKATKKKEKSDKPFGSQSLAQMLAGVPKDRLRVGKGKRTYQAASS